MEINERSISGAVHILSLDGEMDLYNATDLKDTVTEMFVRGIKHLVIDLEQLEYIDSSGISALLFTYTQCRTRSVDLAFINVRGSVRRVIELTSLIGFFPIAENLTEALSRFGVRQG